MNVLRQVSSRILLYSTTRQLFKEPLHKSVINGIKYYQITPKLYSQSMGTYCSKSDTPVKKHPLGKVPGKMQLIYTCKICNTINSHFISKVAYEHGVVIVTCSGCQNKHLIADNLNWFQEGKRTIEDIMAEKGETVKKCTSEGCTEITVDEIKNRKK